MVAMQAQAEYESHQCAQRESKMTIGVIVGAIAGAAVVSGDVGEGALEGRLVGTDHGPVKKTAQDRRPLHEDPRLGNLQRSRQRDLRG